MLEVEGEVRYGAAAVDLVFVACGRGDVYYEEGLGAYDWEAGKLIVREAGGTVTTYGGEPHLIGHTTLMASNGLIHQAVVDTLGARLG